MSVSDSVPIQYHQQDTDYYCGAACSQMVLESIGAGLQDQDDLYTDLNGKSTTEPGWATGPDGLEWTLNDRRPPNVLAPFELAALGSEGAISRRICWAIHTHKVAPVALVNGWSHWLVVLGYSASQHPAGPGDTSYLIDGFDVNDPWPPVPGNGAQKLPPPHSPGDGCGTGGDRGFANQHMAYKAWQDTMTGVPGDHWKGKFLAVSVADQIPPPDTTSRDSKQKPGPRNGPRRRVRRRARSLVTPARARTLAEAGLKDHGLYARNEWKSALERAAPSAGRLVQRLDRDDSFYSLVPFNAVDRSDRSRARAPERTSVVALIDARTGEYLQSARLPRPSARFIRLSLSDAEKYLSGRRIELGNDLGRLLVRKEALTSYPHLVWRPCRESPSPFFPFYMFISGRHRIYVRIDGEVFPSLTLDVRGA